MQIFKKINNSECFAAMLVSIFFNALRIFYYFDTGLRYRDLQ